MNVLALVNKGLAMFQWKNDVRAAEQCCEEALRIDPESEAAVATLAQLSLQQNKIDVAVQLFERQADLARSEPELVSALTYKYVRRFLCPALTLCSPESSPGVGLAAAVHPRLPRNGDVTIRHRAGDRSGCMSVGLPTRALG